MNIEINSDHSIQLISLGKSRYNSIQLPSAKRNKTHIYPKQYWIKYNQMIQPIISKSHMQIESNCAKFVHSIRSNKNFGLTIKRLANLKNRRPKCTTNGDIARFKMRKVCEINFCPESLGGFCPTGRFTDGRPRGSSQRGVCVSARKVQLIKVLYSKRVRAKHTAFRRYRNVVIFWGDLVKDEFSRRKVSTLND